MKRRCRIRITGSKDKGVRNAHARSSDRSKEKLKLLPHILGYGYVRDSMLYTCPPVDKLWGHEFTMYNGGAGYCCKQMTVLNNGLACSVHFHAKKTETFFVVRGVLALELFTSGWDKLHHIARRGPLLLTMLAGQHITIKPNIAHRFWAPTGIVRFIEASSHDEASDSYRLIPAGVAPRVRTRGYGDKLKFIYTGVHRRRT